MTKAIGIATRALNRGSLRAAIAVLLSSIILGACGGGASTVENPVTQGTGNNNDNPYTGPVAADSDVLKFQQEFWANAKTTDRCGSCHNETVGQMPMFVRNDDVNLAYAEAVGVVNRDQPSLSEIVAKVSSPPLGHNCWVADPGVCGTIMTTWIENWIGATSGGGRQIVLTPPASTDPSNSRNFPDDPALFYQHVYQPVLGAYCAGCHSSESSTPQQPYFAEAGDSFPDATSPSVASAYEAAKSKINLDTPGDSRFVIKVSPGAQGGEAHNCWNNDCPTASTEMLAAVTAFANAIDPTEIDPNLLYSKAVRLVDGTVASGGNRYENDQIALWEFKTGTGSTAFDSSGVDPAIDLNFSGDVTWYGGWGITIGASPAQGPGKAQGSTTASRKLSTVLQESGEFSIEAWVVPANVTQEMARIVTYSGGQTTRNFALQQTLYNYDFLLRTNASDADGNPLTSLNGDPQLSTPDAAEVLQATLQHVVATYRPDEGRRIYVNGVLVSAVDDVPGGTFVDWQDTFALVLGNETSSDGTFEGTFRLAAIHRRSLTQEQIQQNFDAGVGERFYLLFDISERIGAPVQTSYVLFEAQQFDSYAYLFDKPHFTTLDGSAPTGITMQGMRIAMNGREAPVGQSYANIDVPLDLVGGTLDELGQSLSVLGAVLPLEKGPEDDQFFLTFDNLDGVVFNRDEDPMLVVTDYMASDEARKPDIGVRTFDEIDAAYAAITGVDRMSYQVGGNFVVDETYQELRQSLPAIEDVEAFLSSHQVAIAQLAIQYCDAAVEDETLWSGLNLGSAPDNWFSNSANRNSFVEPLILSAAGHSSTSPQIASQPTYTVIHSELAAFPGAGNRPENLIDRLLAGSSDTPAIAKGVCASVLGSAVTLVQ